MLSSTKVYVGKCVTRSDTQLIPVSLQKLYEKIKLPKPEFRTTIQRLRTLQTINLPAYREEKKNLPFFTCGSFVPLVRHSRNFGSISCFVIDIDHLSEKGITPEDAKNRLENDNRVALAFTSPGSDGIKVLFVLSEPCYDASLFSLFYREFAGAFARDHDFEQVLDKRTSDVTRVCFMSYDPDVYLNPDATLINWGEWVNTNNELTLSEQAQQQKDVVETAPPDNGNREQRGPDSEVLAQIKSKLNPAGRPTQARNVYVPEQLRPVTEEIQRRVEEFNMQVVDLQNIQYGRKFKFTAGNIWAELNLFYGKKGFSVVATPKRGSNQELAELSREVVLQIITEMESAQVENHFNISVNE